jgi:hypothetical protein
MELILLFYCKHQDCNAHNVDFEEWWIKEKNLQIFVNVSPGRVNHGKHVVLMCLNGCFTVYVIYQLNNGWLDYIMTSCMHIFFVGWILYLKEWIINVMHKEKEHIIVPIPSLTANTWVLQPSISYLELDCIVNFLWKISS